MLRKTHSLFLSLALGAALSTQASLIPSSGYDINQVLSGYKISAMDVYENTGTAYAYGWSGGSLKQFSVSGDSLIGDLGSPPDSYSSSSTVSCSFVTYNPADGSVWVGYTDYANTGNDRIYKVSSGGTWTEVASVQNNYSLTFYGTEAFISAGSSDWSSNLVYWMDSGSGATVLFASLAGNSAQVTSTSSALIVPTYGSTEDSIWAYGSTLIADFLADPNNWTVLDAGDGTLVTTTPSGVGGVTADASDEVYYSVNVYDGNTYSSVSYIYDQYGNLIATSDPDIDSWMTVLSSTGTIEIDGVLYVLDYYSNGIYALSVPEPGTYALLGGVAMLIFSLYRRCRKTRLRE
jgi:hypothetical protein